MSQDSGVQVDLVVETFSMSRDSGGQVADLRDDKLAMSQHIDSGVDIGLIHSQCHKIAGRDDGPRG